MNTKEIKEMPAKELELKLREVRAELMSLRTKKSSGQLEKPHMLKALRKDTARILTQMNALKNAAPKVAAAPKAIAKPAPKAFKKTSAKNNAKVSARNNSKNSITTKSKEKASK